MGFARLRALTHFLAFPEAKGGAVEMGFARLRALTHDHIILDLRFKIRSRNGVCPT